MNLNHSGVSKMPSAPIVQKTYCQPNLWTIQPINGANNTRQKYCDELKMADAVPRSFAGNQAATNLPFPGNAGARANPARNKSANNTTNAETPFSHFVKPIRTTNSDQRKIPAP